MQFNPLVTLALSSVVLSVPQSWNFLKEGDLCTRGTTDVCPSMTTYCNCESNPGECRCLKPDRSKGKAPGDICNPSVLLDCQAPFVCDCSLMTHGNSNCLCEFSRH